MSIETIYEQFFVNQTTGEIRRDSALVAIVIVMSLIQVSPLKLNPWSIVQKIFHRVLKYIGDSLNGAIVEDLKSIRASQLGVELKLDQHILDDERDKMDTRRQRILRFNSDLMRGQLPTHEYYCDMLVDIDLYERYCKTHPDYPNSKATMAIENIRNTGIELERSGGWAEDSWKKDSKKKSTHWPKKKNN